MTKRAANFYDVLGLSPQATDEQVRVAYRTLAKRWHPDQNPQNRDKAHVYCALLNKAYAHLRTAPQRRAYDRYLQSLRPATTARAAQLPAGTRRIPARTNNSRNSYKRENGVLSILREIFWPLAPYQQEVRTSG